MYLWETIAAAEGEAAQIEAAFYRFVGSDAFLDDRPYLGGYTSPAGRVVTVGFSSAQAMDDFRRLLGGRAARDR